MPIQMFEKPDEDYVKWFAVQTLDSLRQWLQILRFSKNQIKFCQVLERRVAETCKLKPNNQNTPFKPLVDLNTDKNDDDDENDKESVEDQVKHNADIAADIVLTLSRTATSTKYDPLALLKVVEQSGIDVSDFNILGAESGQGSDNHDNNDEQTAEGLFQPGSLLSKPKKSALENDAHMEPEIEMFAKGSLLSQTRESKAMTASRAMQDVMAHDGNVFTQGSLLQVTNETKLRPPHMGGAAHVLNPQFPLVQLEDPEFARPGGLIHQAMSTNINHEAVYAAHYNVQPDPPIFGGLLADHAQQTVPQHPDIYHHSRSNGQHAQQY
ncbi:hypothetical protein COEREDRAFT_80735 [Coemansia reversa NRRL 1564]|uniref:Uncharacterized protein n=1 Tax=Coemansia reversa (strain ATCC 12441 / NRRL 1564) TaxID=763665 RepID=A0A2G5BDF2_COERN|nr:hypothetical protein COEREDRAFT_80735 [Coemansia reversa NRRL 1564]|eukprot:PIA17012.1 hypothetical protein COEREDRAFT_80735 [Coemansia reversa NRRL 1564]